MKRRHSRAVSLFVFVIVISMSVVSDRITKSLAEIHLGGGRSQAFIPGILDFRLVYNSGAAWGILEGGRVIFLIIASLTIIAMVVFIMINNKHASNEIIALGLVAGGAIGNGIDRAVNGYVVDFVNTLFVEFPLFNIADSSITVGVILFIIVLLFWNRRPEIESEPGQADPVQGDQKPTSREMPVRSDIKPTSRRAPAQGDQKPAGRNVPVRGDIKPTSRKAPVQGDQKPTSRRTPVQGDPKPASRNVPVRGDIKPTSRRAPASGDLKPASQKNPAQGDRARKDAPL